MDPISSTTLSTSDIIQIAGICVSLLTSVIAIIISVLTVRQNSKMIEESSRAVISVYASSINTGSPTCYLVIRNFGNSQAVVTKFSPNFDFKDCYPFNAPRDYLKELANCSIAPGHSRICAIDYKKITKPVTFDIEYLSSGKTYYDSFTVDLKAGIDMPVSKTATENKELRTISYSLQEMLAKDL